MREWGEGWRDVSADKSADCPSKEIGFNSQHLHDNSPLSITPTPEDPTPSQTYVQTTPMYIKLIKLILVILKRMELEQENCGYGGFVS